MSLQQNIELPKNDFLLIVSDQTESMIKVFLQNFSLLTKCYNIVQDIHPIKAELLSHEELKKAYGKYKTQIEAEFKRRVGDYKDIILKIAQALGKLKCYDKKIYDVVYDTYFNEQYHQSPKAICENKSLAQSTYYKRLGQGIEYIAKSFVEELNCNQAILNSGSNKIKDNKIKSLNELYDRDNIKFHNTELLLDALPRLYDICGYFQSLYIPEEIRTLCGQILEQETGQSEDYDDNQMRADEYYFQMLQFLQALSLVEQYDTDIYKTLIARYLDNYNYYPQGFVEYGRSYAFYQKNAISILSIFLWGMPDIETERLATITRIISLSNY